MKQNPTILITGGTGFAGSHLVEALLTVDKQADSKNTRKKNGIHVTSYGDNTKHVANLLPAKQIHQHDLTDFKKTKELISQLQPDQIYHLAALAAVGQSFNQIKRVLDSNTQIQLSVLQAVKEICPQARVLTIGSALEYKPQDRPLTEIDPLGPVSPYGVSKVTQDMLAYSFYRQEELQIIRTRSFNHIGERQASGFVVSDFAQQIVDIEQGRQDNLKVGNVEAIRDFTDVKDTVQAYITLMEQGEPGEVYNVGSGSGCSIKKILTILTDSANTDINVATDPDRYRPIDVPQVVANIDKIKQLGWTPAIPIKKTLQRTLNYYRSQAS